MMIVKKHTNPWPRRWIQLSSMLDAGLSVESAFKTLTKVPNKDHDVLKKIIYRVSKGSTLTAALLANNIIDKFDAALLDSAETAGRLPQGLKHISELKISQQRTKKTLSGLTLLPKVMLIIGAIAGIFVRTAQQGQSINQAVLDTGIIVIISFIIIRAAIELLTIDARIPLSIGWGINLLHSKSRRFQQHFEQRFYHSLTWQLASGVDAATAIKRNALLLSSKRYQKTVIQASLSAAKGLSLPVVLEQFGLAPSKRMQQTLSFADSSGTIEKAIGHELKLIDQDIQHFNKALIAWWPRAVYVGALLVVVKYMF